MEINESNLTFSFADGTTVIKFDNTDFYRKVFNKLPGSKGVDIIADSNDMLQLIEIKTAQDMNRKTGGELALTTAN